MLFGFQNRKAIYFDTIEAFPPKDKTFGNSNHWINAIEFSDFDYIGSRNTLEGYIATSSSSGNVKIWLVKIRATDSSSVIIHASSSSILSSAQCVDTLFLESDRKIPQVLKFATVESDQDGGDEKLVKMCAFAKSGSITVWIQPCLSTLASQSSTGDDDDIMEGVVVGESSVGAPPKTITSSKSSWNLFLVLAVSFGILLNLDLCVSMLLMGKCTAYCHHLHHCTQSPLLAISHRL